MIQVVFGLGRPEIKKKAPNININIEPVARHKAKSELLTLKSEEEGKWLNDFSDAKKRLTN